MKLYLTFFLSLLFGFVTAQQSYYEEWYSADTKDLPQNSIKSIVPDKYGFIWMTTENGLLRYDGKNFKVFNSLNSNISSNRFTYISGIIATDSLKTYSGDYFEEILISNRSISKLKKTKFSKNLENYEDLLYFNNCINIPKINFINSKIDCQNGNYYLIGEKKITLFNKKNKVIKVLKRAYQENTIYFLNNNELTLLNYKNSTYSFFKNEFATTHKFKMPKNSKIIYNHIVQQLFIYTESNILLFKIDGFENKLIQLFSKSKLNLNIKSLYFNEKTEKLFIGTIDKGLKIITPHRFKTLINPLNINNNYYASFPLSQDEFVTSKGVIFNSHGMVRDLKINDEQNHYSITVDKQKNIWIPFENKLTKFLKSTNYNTSVSYELDYKIATIYCDSKDKIWIGVYKGTKKSAVVYTIAANNNNSKPLLVKNIRETIVFFKENHKHEIYMVCYKKLLLYNQEKENFTTISGGENNFRSIFIAKDNSVWICTYNNGFSLLKGTTFYKMPYDNQMYLQTVHCIKEDNNGNFWISTNKGLIEVNKESLLNYYKKQTPIYYHHYNLKNGFLTNEFNGGCQPCAIELKNQFIFPSLNGMVTFNPNNVNEIKPSNNFYINEAELDGKTQYFKNILYLNRDIDRVKFKIDFAYFGNQDNVAFEAKLEITKKEKWISLTNENEITFTNLPPGNHTLYVRKVEPFGSKYEVKKIIISIPYLFYEKLWFKILAVLLLISLIALVIKLRYRLIRKKNIALEKIIKERTFDLNETVSNLEVTKNNLSQEILQQKKLIGTISHDIKSPLKFLSITAKHLHDKSVFSENENVKNNAKVMYESASQLFRFVENLVDYSKVFIEHNDINKLKKENIDIIINEKINLFKNIAAGNTITITYKNLALEQISLNKRVFGIIIHNLLDNAIKNTNNGKIAIETNILNNKIYVSVEDSGVGMSKEIKEYYINIQKNYETDKLAIQNYGMGLHMVLELLRLLKGEMKIISEEGKGTKVTVIVDNN